MPDAASVFVLQFESGKREDSRLRDPEAGGEEEADGLRARVAAVSRALVLAVLMTGVRRPASRSPRMSMSAVSAIHSRPRSAGLSGSGIFCFVALGQIVNRRFQTLRYQPSGLVVASSPVAVTPLAAAVVRGGQRCRACSGRADPGHGSRTERARCAGARVHGASLRQGTRRALARVSEEAPCDGGPAPRTAGGARRLAREVRGPAPDHQFECGVTYS